MSLKKNILASYVSQIYVTMIGILIVPLYIKYMGAEAYGLVGFFAMLQAWFNLLDMGLTPTMSRETARFRGGALDAISFRSLVRALEGIFGAIALIGGCILFFLSGWVASNWLNASQLPVREVENSIRLMAISISLRWMSGLYRSQISGSERLVWLSGYNITIATLRFVGVLTVLMFVSDSPSTFFSYQLAVATIELAGLAVMAYRLLPPMPPGVRSNRSWAPLKPVLRFSLTIAFTSSVWVLVTQTDKLVLSKVLPLAEYGYFTLAVLVASSVMAISGPISTAIMPRMAKLEAEGDHKGLINVYRQSTQLVAIIAGAVSVTMALFAEPLLWAWTGDKLLASQAAPILKLYAVGNGVLAVAAFPYYLQYAKGDLRLHLKGNAVFVLMLIPSIICAANQFGGIGAGYVWLGMNLLSFVVWLPFVHHKFEPGLNLKWYGQDILAIILVTTIAGYCLSSVLPYNVSRWRQAGDIVMLGIFVALAGASASSAVYARVRDRLCRHQMR